MWMGRQRLIQPRQSHQNWAVVGRALRGWAGTGVCALMEGDTGLLLFHHHLVSRQQRHRHQSLLQARRRHQREGPEQTETPHWQLRTRHFTHSIALNTSHGKQSHRDAECPSFPMNVRSRAWKDSWRHYPQRKMPCPAPPSFPPHVSLTIQVAQKVPSPLGSSGSPPVLESPYPSLNPSCLHLTITKPGPTC